MTSRENGSPPIVVRVDPDLHELVPEFLRNRHDDVRVLRGALASADWETIRRLGHRMTGSGGGYGFDTITDLGQRLEMAARARSERDVRQSTDDLADYLDRVVVE